MIKLKKNVALIARPDHSYFIYEELLQSKLSFIYVTFKLCPQCIGRFFRIQRIRWAKRDCYQSLIMTLHNIGVYNLNWEWPKKFNGGKIFTNYIAKILGRYDFKLIHYWPDYCVDYICHYRQEHPKIRTIADIYFPCAETIINDVESALSKYGLTENLNGIRNKILKDRHIMECETDFIVPSPYVADTYKKKFPDKRFFIVSYGITKWDGYRKKEIPEKIYRFVYVGTVSVEKGCDFLCEWFKKHQEYELHLIGKVHPKEDFVFEKYSKLPNIIFEGVIPKSKVQETVSLFDIGIHMSRFDAYSLAVSEVVSAGLPVVVSTTTGIAFDILRFRLGKSCPLDDTSLDEAISNVIDYYSDYINFIDDYMRTSQYDYGKEIIKTYERILGGNA